MYGRCILLPVEDIVNDLIESEIKVEAKDVVKKSKPEAALCSYKISVPSADLTKTLDPSTWPMGVKVREFIHYSNKPEKSDERKTIMLYRSTNIQYCIFPRETKISLPPMKADVPIFFLNIPVSDIRLFI